MKTYMFVDLETSGLDPELDRIVEIAWTFTDRKLRRMSSTTHTPVQPVGAALSRIYENDVVREMHRGTGLLDELEKGNLPLLAGVEDSILAELDTIEEHYQAFVNTLTPEQQLDPVCTPSMEFHLAGKNVHFDRAFIDRHMPRLSKRLSHRMFDETSVKAMLETLEIGIGLVAAENVGGLTRHRAAFDVEVTLATMQFAVEQLHRIGTGQANIDDENFSSAYFSDGTGFQKVDFGQAVEDELREMNGGD